MGKQTKLKLSGISGFLRGSRYAFSGCRAFYRDRKAWKYATLPLAAMTGLYVLLFCLILRFFRRGAETLNRSLDGLPDWLRWLTSLVSGLSSVLGVLSALFLVGTTVCALYEVFGGLFFDPLIEYYEEKNYGVSPRRQSPGRISRYCLDALFFGVKTSLLFVFLFALGFFFPVAGQILLAGSMGYCAGIAYALTPANTLGLTLADLRSRVRGRRSAVLGFGLTVYLLHLIPFAMLLLLPGLVLGGADLVNRELRGGGPAELPPSGA